MYESKEKQMFREIIGWYKEDPQRWVQGRMVVHEGHSNEQRCLAGAAWKFGSKYFPIDGSFYAGWGQLNRKLPIMCTALNDCAENFDEFITTCEKYLEQMT
jgi:hypothetical protein